MPTLAPLIPSFDPFDPKTAPKVAADSNIVVYPDAPHGFNADYRPSYVEKDAKDAWAKMLAFFKAHGVS